MSFASCRPYAVQDQSAFARDRHELGRAATRHSASAMISKAAPAAPASGSIPAQADAQAGCYIMDVLCYLHSRAGKGAPQQLPLHPAAISPSLSIARCTAPLTHNMIVVCLHAFFQVSAFCLLIL